MKKLLVAVALVLGLGSSVAFAQAIAKSYEDATIKEAYVAEKETGKVYKVILTTKDAQEVTVLLNEKGEEVKEIK